MSTQRPTHPIVATLLALATFLAPHAPLLHAQDGASVWLPLVHQGSAQVTTLPASDLLFRTQLTIHTSAKQARLTQLGVTVLAQRDERATTLVDYAQLQILARLGYQPRNTVEFGALIAAGAPQKPWLVRSLQPLTQQLQVARAAITAAADQAATESQADTAALTALRSAVNSLSLAQRAAVNELPTLDFDGDGLTDTEESWWCTDPQNPNSDGDAQGYGDGQEVAALLDVTQPRTVRWGYGPPFGPPNTWPDFNGKDGNTNTPACNDGDWDTIPDFAEVYMVGTRVPAESTDGDKFDDGQELFGITYFPGAPTNCGYGSYPAIEYWNFIKATMPNWVADPVQAHRLIARSRCSILAVQIRNLQRLFFTCG